MVRKFLDRCAYALIGGVGGFIAATLLWILIHSHRLGVPGSTVFDAGFSAWAKALSAIFAVIGFIAKDGVGDAVGEAVDMTYKAAVDEDDVPRWLVFAVLVGVAIVVWYVVRANSQAFGRYH